MSFAEAVAARPKKNDVFVWRGVRCTVTRVGKGWADLKVQPVHEGMRWSWRVQLPLPQEFAQVGP